MCVCMRATCLLDSRVVTKLNEHEKLTDCVMISHATTSTAAYFSFSWCLFCSFSFYTDHASLFMYSWAFMLHVLPMIMFVFLFLLFFFRYECICFCLLSSFVLCKYYVTWILKCDGWECSIISIKLLLGYFIITLIWYWFFSP